MEILASFLQFCKLQFISSVKTRDHRYFETQEMREPVMKKVTLKDIPRFA